MGFIQPFCSSKQYSRQHVRLMGCFHLVDTCSQDPRWGTAVLYSVFSIFFKLLVALHVLPFFLLLLTNYRNCLYLLICTILNLNGSSWSRLLDPFLLRCLISKATLVQQFLNTKPVRLLAKRPWKWCLYYSVSLSRMLTDLATSHLHLCSALMPVCLLP